MIILTMFMVLLLLLSINVPIAIIVVTARPIAIGTFIDNRSNKTMNIVRITIKYLLFALRLYFVRLNFYNPQEFLKFQKE